jgi:hypothetical protein
MPEGEMEMSINRHFTYSDAIEANRLVAQVLDIEPGLT